MGEIYEGTPEMIHEESQNNSQGETAKGIPGIILEKKKTPEILINKIT